MVRKRYADPCHVNLFLFHVPILKMPRIPPGLCSFALRSQFNLSALQSLFHSVYVSLIAVDDIFMSKAFCVRHFSINVSLSFGHSLNNSAAIFFGQSYCHHVFPWLAFACLMGEVLLSIDPLSIPMSYFPERFLQIANIQRFSCGLRRELPIIASMTKQPIMIRVVVVCPVTGCYRVVWRQLIGSMAERLAAG